MDFETVFQQACDHETTQEESEIIINLLSKTYNDEVEAVTTAFLVGRMVGKSLCSEGKYI